MQKLNSNKEIHFTNIKVMRLTTRILLNILLTGMELLWYESKEESDWLMMQLNAEIEKHEDEYFIWLGIYPLRMIRTDC